MKKLFLLALCAVTMPMMAQTEEQPKDSVEEGWKFTTVDSVAITPVKNQHRSSTP